MHITGLDYITMMVDSLDHTCSTLEAALGLDFGPERRQGGWGTATRAAVFPRGTYLEVMAVTDATADPTGPAKQRGLPCCAAATDGSPSDYVPRTWLRLGPRCRRQDCTSPRPSGTSPNTRTAATTAGGWPATVTNSATDASPTSSSTKATRIPTRPSSGTTPPQAIYCTTSPPSSR